MACAWIILKLSPTPQPMEKLSSTKPVPGAKKVGDRWTAWQTNRIMGLNFWRKRVVRSRKKREEWEKRPGQKEWHEPVSGLGLSHTRQPWNWQQRSYITKNGLGQHPHPSNPGLLSLSCAPVLTFADTPEECPSFPENSFILVKMNNIIIEI